MVRLRAKASKGASLRAVDHLPRAIVVCGDLVWDTHIARLPFNPRGYFQPHLQSQLDNRHGGAWYLHDVIGWALDAMRQEVTARLADRQRELDEARRRTDPAASAPALKKLADAIEQARRWAGQFEPTLAAPKRVGHMEIEEGQIGGVAKGFSVWEWFDGKAKPAKAKSAKDGTIKYKWSEGEPQPGTWRIKEFLGCQQPVWTHPKGFPALKIPSAPHVLVIDDLGLGFADHPESWPACLNDPALAPTHILVKASPPFDNHLWRKLLEPQWAARTTVVVSATALRDHGARLSRGLSWDQTIADVKDEFRPGSVGWTLSQCRRVVVPFSCSGAAVFTRDPRSPGEARKRPATLQFERFLFDPAYLENTWATDAPGITFGTTSVITATLAVDTLMDPCRSTHITVSRGLAAARSLHRVGGAHQEAKLKLDGNERDVFAVDSQQLPEDTFRSAFPRDLLDAPQLVRTATIPDLDRQTLLTDVVGLTPAFLAVAAEDIVRLGKDRPLASVPRLECGQYFTVDREEIERLNTVRNLILDYGNNKSDKRPLSLAVFGPPGAGKSFAIKQLSEELFGKDRAVLEFNLSQFADLGDLHEAFHEVRDKSVAGQMPFVFWDEFDCQRQGTALGWLKEFLAPMQDAQFVANGKAHPFAKCIFIFAGGTAPTFAQFDRSADKDNDDFRNVKGPDFVSRLRGYVNIKGPNPTQDAGDEVYVIRRALLLRSLIERHHPAIVQGANKEVVIHPTLLDAFLHAGDGKSGTGYRHGARSMEALVSLSRLHGSRHFGPSELPPREVAELHVTTDFADKVADKTCYHFSPADFEAMAAILHRHWRESKVGYVYGPTRDDNSTPKTHPLMVDYEELSEKDKDGNRLPARLTALRLAALGYDVVPVDRAPKSIKLSNNDLKVLAVSEHRRWTRQKLLDGYTYVTEKTQTNDALRLHRDICKWDDLPDDEKHLDSAIVAGILEFLRGRKLALVERQRR